MPTRQFKERGFVLAAAIITVLGLGLAACSTSQVVQPTDNPDEVVRHLNAVIPDLMQRHHVTGVAAALVRDGAVIWAQGYGLADKEHNMPVTLETVFQAGSVSKPVTAWGVMKLVEKGRLDLDAPVERYLTRWHLPPSEFDNDQVTIRRLLSHTAGTSVKGYAGFDPDRGLPTLEESLSGAEGFPKGGVRVVQQPGAKLSYSGGGFALLQLVIEEVTGETFSGYMQREVLEPLGMTNSSFEWTPRLRSKTAIGYNAAGHPLPNYLFTAKAAAGLYTTAPDLARFVAATMAGSEGEPAGRGVLKPNTVQLMLSPANATDGTWALGYGIVPGDELIVGHEGSNQGWHSLFVVLPASRQGIVMVTNSDWGMHFQEDLVPCVWSGLLPGNPLQNWCQEIQSGRNKLLPVAGGLALGLIIYVAWVATGVLTGCRRLGWKFSWRSVLGIALPLLVIVPWWVAFYTTLFAPSFGAPAATVPISMLPTTFEWITRAVTLWGFALIVAAFVPRVKQKTSIGNTPS
jgi:CubicO group peptidase (beta-lactamase class C family)